MHLIMMLGQWNESFKKELGEGQFSTQESA